ncbi:MAG: hypothetical protein GC162_04255 [Planctomycetes bacterium]|nr:hypothetical protein [Planctomycetota bacterium]
MKRFAHVLICLCVAASRTPAADTGALPGYTDYQTFAQQVADLAKHPHVKVDALGQTLGKREVYALTIADGEPATKPALLIVGSVEAPQLFGSELAMRLARRLADEGDLLKRFTFYIIPRPTPDASEAFFTKPYVERSTNHRPTDDDRDAAVDEDGPEDLNHDGFITMMRIEDPTGEWIAHPDDPRLMIKADASKGEAGKYKLYVEGVDNDHDELFNEDGPGGVNFNRNFPNDYPYFKEGAGPHQVSEVETRAVADFAFDHNNIAAVFTFSPDDNLFHPWKGRGERDESMTMPGKDAMYAGHFAEIYSDLHGGKNPPPAGSGKGAFVPWCYEDFGRWSFGTRAWWPPTIEQKKEDDKKEDKKKDGRDADEMNLLHWMDKEKIDGFVNWTPIQHPDFPDRKVEVGGFKPFVAINPPAGELDALADKHMKAIAKLIDLMPRVKIDHVKVEPLGGSVYRLTALIINDGYLPTMSEMGRISREPNPLQAAIELPKGATFLQGFSRRQFGPIAGSGGHEELAWLIHCDAGEATMRVYSPTTGSTSTKVTLP